MSDGSSQDAPVPAGPDPSTFQPHPCSDEKTRCFVCEIKALAATTAATKSAQFSTEDFVLNIVGIRRADSLDNKFDDFMTVFAKLPLDAKTAGLDAIEAELKDSWRECFGKVKDDHFRLAPCSNDGVTYAVGFFDQVTTDPGLDKLSAFADATAAVSDATSKVATPEAEAKTQKDLDDCSKSIDDKKAEIKKAKPDPPAKPKGTQASGPMATLKQELKVLETRKKALEKTKKDQKNADSALVRANKALVKAQKEHLLKATDAETYGIDDGKGQIRCGQYQGSFRLGVHNRSGEKFAHGHVAYVVGTIAGVRYRSVGSALSNASHDHTIARLIRNGKVVDEVPDGAKLVPDGPNAKTGSVKHGSVLTKLEPDDVVVTNSHVTSTNLHRAHNARWEGEIITGVSSNDAVNEWSEGCQTYRNFEMFNAFLRIGQLTRRIRCQKSGAAAGAACYRLARSGKEGDPLNASEQLVKDFMAKNGATGGTHALRDRCNFFHADHLRSCDLTEACAVTFTYTLVSASEDTPLVQTGASAGQHASAVDDLAARFKRPVNGAWDGNLFLKS